MTKSLGARLKATAVTYLGGSSIRGLPRVIKASSSVSTIAWFIVIVSFTGFAIWQTCEVVNDYFKYETTFQERTDDDLNLPFPSVTICNLQPLNSGATAKLAMERYQQKLKELVVNSDMDVFDPMRTMSGFFQNTKRAVIRNISHSRDSIIRDCSYKFYHGNEILTRVCNRSTMTHFPHPSYFNCYTINPNVQEHLDDAKSGKDGLFIRTLLLTVYLDDFAYPFFFNDFEPLAMRHGIRLVIHPPTTYPDIENQAHEVMPGTFASFQVHTHRWHFQEPPYGNCSLGAQHTLKVADPDNKATLRYAYDQNTCNQLCLQRTIIERCSCLDPHLPIPLNYSVNDESYNMDIGFRRRKRAVMMKTPADEKCYYVVPYCLKWKDAEDRMDSINLFYNRWRCWSRHKSRLALHRAGNTCKRTDISCTATCNHTEYRVIPTFSSWPHESFYEVVHKKWIKPVPSIAKHFTDFDAIFERIHQNNSLGYELLQNNDRIRRNFIRIRVTRKDAAVKTSHSIPVYPLGRLLSSVGGTVNLWSGITMIAFIEFLELFILLLKIVFESICQRNDDKESCVVLLDKSS